MKEKSPSSKSGASHAGKTLTSLYDPELYLCSQCFLTTRTNTFVGTECVSLQVKGVRQYI